MIRLVRAEWTKLFTTRVWLGLLLGACAMVAGFAALLVAFAVSANATVLTLILGIIGMTQEYRHRTATPTFLTTPRRGRVVVAKLLAYAAASAVFSDGGPNWRSGSIGVCMLTLFLIFLNGPATRAQHDGPGGETQTHRQASWRT